MGRGADDILYGEGSSPDARSEERVPTLADGAVRRSIRRWCEQTGNSYATFCEGHRYVLIEHDSSRGDTLIGWADDEAEINEHAREAAFAFSLEYGREAQTISMLDLDAESFDGANRLILSRTEYRIGPEDSLPDSIISSPGVGGETP